MKNNQSSLRKCLLICTLFFSAACVHSQLQQSKWYFGQKCALDFSTGSPVTLDASAMALNEGCASMADEQGNLLFYTSGDTVWNASHHVMANGTGILGSGDAVQSSLILRKPGTLSQYCLFTVQGFAGDSGLRCTTIDMSMSAGMGSVTVKNAVIYNAKCAESLTGSRHANGTDFWIIMREDSSVNFRAYLLTSAGISAQPVVSSVGPYGSVESMKISPDGTRLALATAYPDNLFAVFDFDVATGVVSNKIVLSNPGTYPYAVEFSADGRKLYGSDFINLYQWDLNAGSAGNVILSMYTYTTQTQFVASLQRAPDGRIYVARPGNAFLGAFMFPDSAASQAGFCDSLIATGGSCTMGLPNFICDAPVDRGQTTYSTNIAVTGVQEHSGQPKLKCFPNPARELLHVSGTADAASYFQIISADGKVSSCEKVFGQTIDVSALAPGIYILRQISGDRITGSVRFIRE